MASEVDALHTPLGTVFVVALLVGWATAGVVVLTQAPLLVGSAFGVAAVGVTLYWGWRR